MFDSIWCLCAVAHRGSLRPVARSGRLFVPAASRSVRAHHFQARMGLPGATLELPYRPIVPALEPNYGLL